MIKFFKSLVRKWGAQGSGAPTFDGVCTSAEEFHALLSMSIERENRLIIDTRGTLREELKNQKDDQFETKVFTSLKNWLRENKKPVQGVTMNTYFINMELDFFRNLFVKNKRWINEFYLKETPLQYSAKNSAIFTTQILVELGAKIWLPEAPLGRQPFMLANYRQALTLEENHCAAYLVSTSISSTFWKERITDNTATQFVEVVERDGLDAVSEEVLKLLELVCQQSYSILMHSPDIESNIANELQRRKLHEELSQLADINDEPIKKRKM